MNRSEIVKKGPSRDTKTTPEKVEESEGIKAIRATTKREVDGIIRNLGDSIPDSWIEVLKVLKREPERRVTEGEINRAYRGKATQRDPDLEMLATRMNLALAGWDFAIEITPHPSGRRSQDEWSMIHNMVQIMPKPPAWLRQFHRGLQQMSRTTQSKAWRALLRAIAGKYEGVPIEQLEEIPEVQEYSAGLRKLIDNINLWGLKDTDAQIHIRNDIVIIGAKDEIPIVQKTVENPERELTVLRSKRTKKQEELKVATILAVEYAERLERAKRILTKMQGKTSIHDKEQKPKRITREETDSAALPQNQIQRLQTATRLEALEALRGIDWPPTEKAIMGTLPETRQVREESVEKINKPEEEKEPIPLTMLRTLINLRLAQFGLQLEVIPDPSGRRSQNVWNLQVSNTTILYEGNERIENLHKRAEIVTSKIRSKTVRSLLETLLYKYSGVPIAELENEPVFTKYGGGLRMLITNTNNQNLAKFGLMIHTRNGMVILGNRHEGILAVAPPSENTDDDINRERASLAYATQELKVAATLAADYHKKLLDTEKLIDQLRPPAAKPAQRKQAGKTGPSSPVRHRGTNGRTFTGYTEPSPHDMHEIEDDEDETGETIPNIEPAEPEGLDGQQFLHRSQLRTAIQNEVKTRLQTSKVLKTTDLDEIRTKLDALSLPWNLADLRGAYTVIIDWVRKQASEDGTIPPAAISKIFTVPA